MDQHSDDTPVTYRVVGFDELEGAAAEHYRRQRRRRLLLFVTLPGLVLGTATVATAYGTGLIGSETPTCAPIVEPAPERDSFDIQLLNSNDTDGLGTDVARELTLRDFSITSVGNADSSVYVKGAATIYYGPEGRDNALLLQKQIPGSKVWNDARPGDSVQLVLGYGFDKLVSEPEPPLPAPSEITLNVYNTTWQEGLASEVAGDLKDRGFKVKATGNDPKMSFLEDEVAIIRFGPEGQRAAKRLAQHVEGVQLQKDDRTTNKVDLVLGNKWDDLKPASQVPEVKPYVRPAETIQKPCTPEGS
ncbi:LytR C-terminal domain-containing protein [Janibacter hoylei]|uniref:LytR C-terminal domain-containing protein n=1 Tax=Janibacter hoylei TaxID=364298 RepID=UPI0021A766B1|nr:LytR C-terminal domain-containing protein [Janibacter hoylei]MCT1620165.1 LytR C-terminal domain-containing protein [Janibacter hoylei]MCT2294005.1 LytR C-terminal domain-containing protein [Janibacter hoylei]